MNPETQAVLAALPGPGERGETIPAVAVKAGLPLWKARCAVSALKAIAPGTIEDIGPATAKRGATGEHLYRRAS
ncbi:hypothetical protein Sp245p_03455 [Azospirillum baldaniorum]|uniref:Uncharacterized protein n=1 Tax=Azospirillum baldaniorum TaxID=1064539 RepID=A0A9P1NN22_9PROT|nr:hypothetical protein [Azospirillum baldaniorum]AWJ88911.1 hypothetical protein Sp245p_03455 [Azospirillum baldaniorum]TWA73380.1 hypothetical protein FBZ85_11672 [Azospirillum brasilense]CCC99379.1 protein of unknown function [Azospirillum baldaniorum]